MGPTAKAATAPLLEMLKDENEEVRWDAILALEKTGPAVAIPVLMNRLQGNDQQARETAALALRSFGTVAKATVPALTALLGHRESGVRRAAAFVLGQMGSEAKPAIPALTALLKDNDGQVRQAAASPWEISSRGQYRRGGHRRVVQGRECRRATGGCRRPGKSVAGVEGRRRALRKVAQRQRGGGAPAAAASLDRLAPAAKAALPALPQLLKDKDPVVRRFASIPWERRGAAAIAAAKELLNDGDGTVRQDAADALREIGTRARTAIPGSRNCSKTEGRRWVCSASRRRCPGENG